MSLFIEKEAYLFIEMEVGFRTSLGTMFSYDISLKYKYQEYVFVLQILDKSKMAMLFEKEKGVVILKTGSQKMIITQSYAILFDNEY